MKLDNLQTELDFLRGLKASCQYYWACVASKRQAVAEILLELDARRKTDRKADRWWHQYQNMNATMSDTVAAVKAAIRFIAVIEQKHGLDPEWSWDQPIGSRCLAMTAPLCPTCEAADVLDIDWKDAPNERRRFWKILDNYSNDYRAGMIWIVTQHEQILNVLPPSAVRDDIELAYSKLRWRLIQACGCSAMVGSREFNSRKVNAVIDDGRMAYYPNENISAAEAVLDRVALCPTCRPNVISTEIDTRTELDRVVGRRRNKQSVGG